MEPEVQKTAKTSAKLKTKYIIIIAVAAFSLLMLSAASVFSYMILQNDTVYNGVRVSGQEISKLSEQELKAHLESKYQAPVDNMDVTLKTDKSTLTAKYTDLGVRFDTAATTSEAYSVGRRGNIFERLYEITKAAISGVDVDLPFIYDEDKLDHFIDEFYDMTLINVKEGALLISDTGVEILSGSHGEYIDKAQAKEMVKRLIESNSSGTVEPEVIITPPSKFNIDELYEQIISDTADATYIVENSTLKLIPHSNGRHIDKGTLESITSELQNKENVSRQLPVSIVTPEITSEEAESLLFRDELASYSTYFGAGTQNGKNRGHNMGLTAEKINNFILAPGDEFSFNDVVGRRNAENGYKMAHVYSAGKIIDGIGGGICQVSSTMYNAVLKADLKVTERRNHSFTVGYVPLGQDATAFYDAVDFKFVNSTKWPIKLLASVKNNRAYFTIKGTIENPNKEVIISNKILKTTPFVEVFTDDPTKPVGYTDITVPGMAGYVVDTFKTIKVDGKVVSQTKLHTSTYKAYAQQVTRGTAPAAENPVKPPIETVTPVEELPVDEAPPVEAPIDEAPPVEAPIDEAAPFEAEAPSGEA